ISVLVACTLMFCITLIGFASSLRRLHRRNRQLAECLESLSNVVERTRIDFEMKLAAVSFAERATQSHQNGRQPAQDPAAAKIREERGSIHLELRASDPAEESASEGSSE